MPASCACSFLAIVTLLGGLLPLSAKADGTPTRKLFAGDNLVAWCIVPFDAKERTPEQRADMLERLGFKRFAYDWRPEHVASFDAEMDALKRHGIRLQAFWFPATLDADARRILDVLHRHHLHTQLWVMMIDPGAQYRTRDEKVRAAAAILRPVADAAAKIGCTVGLYNHGGWFGDPENQLAILHVLHRPNVGIVYNLHHGHDQIDRFPTLLKKMLPYLYAINLNGMVRGGDRDGRMILPLGQGDLDLQFLKTIRDSGYRGPIGILGHTQNDAEDQLRDNLDGLNWLVRQLDGQPAGPRPTPRTPVPGKPTASPPTTGKELAYDPKIIQRLVVEAAKQGNAQHGAEVFRSPQFACLSCHQIAGHGGTVGPDLTKVAVSSTPAQIVESVLWPRRQIKEGYMAVAIVTNAGKQYTGYIQKQDNKAITLKDPANGTLTRIPRGDIDEQHEVGTLMPDGLTAAMSPVQLRDLIRFLTGLGHGDSAGILMAHDHRPASFAFDSAPLEPELWPHRHAYVNRDRLYDYYQKEADHFRQVSHVPHLLPEYPGLDGGKYGHWGNQNEQTWVDGRWNNTDLGSVMCGGFRGAGVAVPKGVCVRLGEHGELSACFNPQTLRYEALWRDGFVKFSPIRHGFLDGLLMAGTPLPRPAGKKPREPFVYHGFYRHGKRVLFSYRIGNVEMLDAPWAENGKFTRIVAPADRHRFAAWTKGGPPQWPQQFETPGHVGHGGPYVVDTIPPPFDNPWKALLFFGGVDFLPDGTAFVCTIQGDVWRVTGLDHDLQHVRWRRYASGLNQALGLVVANGKVYVLGRDQITCLHDTNGDGEADFYECFSNAYKTSAAGHDFICGLVRDNAGRFYTVSGPQGLVRISADGQRADVLATGMRNPDGIGLLPDGTVTFPCSEGEWTPASMICAVRHDRPQPAYFGYGGPKNKKPPDLPFVYLPRGLDNSSGGQVYISSDRWGPLQGKLVHLSYGAANHFLVLTDTVNGTLQGAFVPLPGDFASGVHRGNFNPKDGQLYVVGMTGWGAYAAADGCFERVRYTGGPVQLPSAFHVCENGVLVSFTRPVDRSITEQPRNQFVQAWNYRYSSAYGSPEFSTRHPGAPGHDVLTVSSVHVLPDGHTIFIELPDLQPVNQLYLRMRVDSGRPRDLFVTVHRLDKPFTAFPGYTPMVKTIAAHPILADMVALTRPRLPNPYHGKLPNARPVEMIAGKNLSYETPRFTVHAGENVKLTFTNPDVVPHNWVLVKPGTLAKVGDGVNHLIAEPDAALRQYIPRTDDVLAYTDITPPGEHFTIWFRAPKQKGRYPFLCTFPGHWMVMNGLMTVE